MSSIRASEIIEKYLKEVTVHLTEHFFQKKDEFRKSLSPDLAAEYALCYWADDGCLYCTEDGQQWDVVRCITLKDDMADTNAVITAQVLRYGGSPPNWAEWGKGEVSPGQSTTIGSGSGPFFTIVGVAGGATFTCGDQLNIVLKVNGTSSFQFELFGRLAGKYMALVS
ncbi:MAG: hypothetical protein SFY32_11235 [Bacteroidota bacterium]|nr:hypothetical protein [Bacteroidota bacterium]